jgi:hypothetical protein
MTADYIAILIFTALLGWVLALAIYGRMPN